MVETGVLWAAAKALMLSLWFSSMAVVLKDDESRGLHIPFFAIQGEGVIDFFTTLHFLDNGINSHFLEGLFPVHGSYHIFYS